MARAPRRFVAGGVYHLLARGNHRECVFLGPPDYQAYLSRLARYAPEHDVTLMAYCLMPNHVHLLVQAGRGSISALMKMLQQSYTQRFNREHDEVGHLFQGRYKALACEDDPYLLTLVRYIHLNPVEARLVARPGDYPYSSHRAYLNGHTTDLVDPRLVLRIIGGVSKYATFMRDAGAGPDGGVGEAAHSSRSVDTPLPAAASGPVARAPTSGAEIDLALRKLCHDLAVSVAAVRGSDRRREASRARVRVAYTLVRQRGFTVSQAAAALGRDVATISQLVWRWRRQCQRDDGVSR